MLIISSLRKRGIQGLVAGVGEWFALSALPVLLLIFTLIFTVVAGAGCVEGDGGEGPDGGVLGDGGRGSGTDYGDDYNNWIQDSDGGVVPPCPDGLTRCYDGSCRNLQSDPLSCGFCGNVCGKGAVCEGGQCFVHATGVNLEQGDALSISVGQSILLIAHIEPLEAYDIRVLWESDNPGVVAVDRDGMVVGLMAGTGNVTVTTVDGGFKDTISVSVEIPVTSLVVEPDALIIPRGGRAQLMITIFPPEATNTTVNWISSNQFVADVDQTGLVTTYSAGEVFIEVSSVVGNALAFSSITVLGTWTDGNTGLHWIDPPMEGGGGTWAEANSYCNSMVMDGSTGWRLPTIDELRTLIVGCPATMRGGTCNATHGGCSGWGCLNDGCVGCDVGKGPDNGCYWSGNLQGVCEWYWTSSQAAPGQAFGVDFSAAQIYFGNMEQTAEVRCVK